MPLLDVDGLSVVYEHHGDRVVAVENFSFSVEPGEILALVGESGSGKSSVALSVTGLLPVPPAVVTARSLRFESHDLLRACPEELQAVRGGRIAYVFQDPATSLNPVLTIGEQLREMIELHAPLPTSLVGGRVRRKAADALALEWLVRVGIPPAQARLGAYPHEFSGGMQQRVCIAMAMAAEPSLLIADEPTSALDVTVQVQILRLLRDLQQRHRLAIVLISHDLLVVERLAHRVAVLRRGRLVETGPVAQVFRQPTHPYTKELLDARSRISLQRPRIT